MTKSKLELLQDVQSIEPCLHQINGVLQVLDEDELLTYQDLNGKLLKWRRKLRDPKFEVAIIGTEKAGKSTFANALLNQNYLPEAKGRCTFTTTRIEASSDSNIAEITFFSRQEFEGKFNALAEEIGYTDIHYQMATLSALDAFLKDKSSVISTSNAVDDLRAIIGSKTQIERYLDQAPIQFTSDIKQRIKEYIVEEDKARAVKNITIKSNELIGMDNLVIYDVPGFDSPTSLHLEQAKKYMLEADVVIMLVSISDRVSFVKAQSDFLNETKDEYGTSLADKMIVIASKFDSQLAPNKNDSEKRIKESLELLDKELDKYGLYRKQNIYRCSALGYLEEKGLVDSNLVLPILSAQGYDNGFSKIKSRMDDFFEKDALVVLNDVVSKDLADIKSFLLNFKLHHNPDRNEEKLEREMEILRRNTWNQAKDHILDKVQDAIKSLHEDMFDFELDEKISQQVEDQWLSSLRVDTKKYKNEQKKYPGIADPERVNNGLRDQIYVESLDLMMSLSSNIIKHENSSIIDQLHQNIIDDCKLDATYAKELKIELESIETTKLFDEKSYQPLILRFVKDIFEILIRSRVSDSTHDNFSANDRIRRFINVKPLIKSTLISAQCWEDELSLYNQPLIKRMLTQCSSQGSSSLEEGQDKSHGNPLQKLIACSTPASSMDEVIKEINADLDTMNCVFSEVLLKAICIESPFRFSLENQIESIRSDINNSQNGTLELFFKLHVKHFNQQAYSRISGDPELNRKLSIISEMIRNMA